MWWQCMFAFVASYELKHLSACSVEKFCGGLSYVTCTASYVAYIFIGEKHVLGPMLYIYCRFLWCLLYDVCLPSSFLLCNPYLDVYSACRSHSLGCFCSYGRLRCKLHLAAGCHWTWQWQHRVHRCTHDKHCLRPHELGFLSLDYHVFYLARTLNLLHIAPFCMIKIAEKPERMAW